MGLIFVLHKHPKGLLQEVVWEVLDKTEEIEIADKAVMGEVVVEIRVEGIIKEEIVKEAETIREIEESYARYEKEEQDQRILRYLWLSYRDWSIHFHMCGSCCVLDELKTCWH